MENVELKKKPKPSTHKSILTPQQPFLIPSKTSTYTPSSNSSNAHSPHNDCPPTQLEPNNPSSPIPISRATKNQRQRRLRNKRAPERADVTRAIGRKAIESRDGGFSRRFYKALPLPLYSSRENKRRSLRNGVFYGERSSGSS